MIIQGLNILTVEDEKERLLERNEALRKHIRAIQDEIDNNIREYNSLLAATGKEGM